MKHFEGRKVKEIRLKTELPDEEIDKLGGTLLNDDCYDIVVTEDCDVYKPNGQPLVKFRKNFIPPQMIKETFPVWRKAATPTNNRGMAGGLVDSTGLTTAKSIKKDGTLSKTSRAKTQVNSGIVGYFDANPRFPYCRLTAFNLEHMDQFQKCMPMIQLIDSGFRELMPDRWKAQMEVYEKTNKDFKIPGTSFTTITVNKNFRTAVHKDQGDLDEGFGVMTAIRAGKYTGGFTAFPKYRVAVDMQTSDLFCADVHSFHGNTPMNGIKGMYERISLVFYYRKGLIHCSSASEERLKAIKQTEAFYERQNTEK